MTSRKIKDENWNCELRDYHVAWSNCGKVFRRETVDSWAFILQMALTAPMMLAQRDERRKYCFYRASLYTCPSITAERRRVCSSRAEAGSFAGRLVNQRAVHRSQRAERLQIEERLFRE